MTVISARTHRSILVRHYVLRCSMRTWAGVLFRWTRLDATIAELAGRGVHFSGDPTD